MCIESVAGNLIQLFYTEFSIHDTEYHFRVNSWYLCLHFPSLESLWGPDKITVSTSAILITFLMLEMQLPLLWFIFQRDTSSFLSCRNYSNSLMLFSTFYSWNFMYSFLFQYFNCGSMRCEREGSRHMYSLPFCLQRLLEPF